ncbi:aminoacyl--tRNA ligase-related protein [Streptomyces sp. NPDC012935]|uniref:aminoacyl--tRNA ligase-related protein n=1 Tax=Streptomyces sp. NPDC012935 TaxID=3364857 RepID=UPI0036A6806E
MRFHHARATDESALQELRKALVFFYGDATVEETAPGFTVTVPADLSEKELGDVVRHFLRGQRVVPGKTVAENGGRPGARCGLPHDDRLEVGPGAYLQGPEWTDAMEATRALVRGHLAARFDVPQLRGSALISRDVLVRAGYYRKFPNLVNAVSRIRSDYWDGVSVAQLRPGQDEALASFYVASDMVLNPVTCYHVYAKAQTLMERYPVGLFGIEGPVFRHESHNHSATRLAEFTMYELVGMGTEEEVEKYFHSLIEAYTELFAALGLPHRIVSASDAFFGDDPTLTRNAQLMSGSKFEVRIPMQDGELSVASVNSHGAAFVDSFELSQGGKVQATCCAGIGLERLTYALKAYDLLP